ncbi:MAG: ABC transporter ATP-binding protein [Candidatus Solibacter usitatus]|nr:ABC transporter ATP-binding protein [Candidatus Solibacter usitatus]
MAPAIALRGVAKRFPGYTALEDITLDIPAGRFLSIVGPSGCGKSTLLNMTAGLSRPSEGAIEIFGEELAGINRRASYMFQQEALLPWKTVRENIQLGLTFRGREGRAAAEQAAAWIHRVGLDGFAASYPYQLSGGMRKRVSMAQCWIVEPEMVLMDEPFAALDVHTRLRMQSEILALWTGSGKTVVFVTHDLEEAISLSDEVVVLSAGPASGMIGRYAVDLPRPRPLIDIKTEPRFVELYRAIWSDLRGEVLKSYERNRA